MYHTEAGLSDERHPVELLWEVAKRTIYYILKVDENFKLTNASLALSTSASPMLES